MEPIRRLVDRVTRAEQESDTAHFFSLLYLGEFLCKLTVVGLLAALEEDDNRAKYRLEYELVRADGVGDWVAALDTILVGPPSQNLIRDFRDEQRELTERLAQGAGWQSEAAQLLHNVCILLDREYSELPAKVSVRRMFQDFAWLRNKTRGHGAPTERFCAASAPILKQALYLYKDSYSMFSHSWAYLHRNISGRYRIVPLSGSCSELQHLKSSDRFSFADGIYIAHTEPLRVPLLSSDVDVSDFWIANGNLRSASYEELSYITDDRRQTSATDYLQAPASLPASETQGLGALEMLDASFTNIPAVLPTYVERSGLESELLGTLHNDRHPVATLSGAGGIGKTSIALRVLHEIASTGRFFAIIWFSARDIDLIPTGPKIVRPETLTPEAIAAQFCRLTVSSATRESMKKVDEIERFTRALSSPNEGPYLFVFDNFETLRNPAELYVWLDTYIRLPNKVLITTRLRDFKGDYPVEVGGMTKDEFDALALQTAEALSVRQLITQGYLEELYRETGGHPYVVKISLGELAISGKRTSVSRIMTSKDAILDALFERSYDFLPATAQRLFLILSAWRSLVPRAGLEAVVLYTSGEALDVDRHIDLLAKSSMIEIHTSSQDGQEFLSVPISASLFGKRKLSVSPWRSAIEADLSLVQLFGAAQETDIRHGLGPRIRRFFSSVARSSRDVEELMPLMELLARKYPSGWLFLADVLQERTGGAPKRIIRAIQQYLEVVPFDDRAWQRLATLYASTQNYLGEVNALVQKSKLPSTPYVEISSAARRLNALFHDGRLKVDSLEKRILVEQLLRELKLGSDQATAADFSQMAWLCLHLQEEDEARQYVVEGLRLDPTEVHRLRLASRLNIPISSTR